MIYFIVLGIFFVIFFFLGFRIVRPTHRGLVERLGKYNHFAEPGFNWIIPYNLNARAPRFLKRGAGRVFQS